MEKQLTPNIIWYWSILCFLKMRSCHWEVKLSHTRYMTTKNSPTACDAIPRGGESEVDTVVNETGREECQETRWNIYERWTATRETAE